MVTMYEQFLRECAMEYAAAPNATERGDAVRRFAHEWSLSYADAKRNIKAELRKANAEVSNA